MKVLLQFHQFNFFPSPFVIIFTKGEVVWSSHVFEKDQSPENPDEKIPWISSTMLQIPLDPQSKHFKIIKAQSHQSKVWQLAPQRRKLPRRSASSFFSGCGMNCIATHVFLASRENDNWITFSGGHSGYQKYRRMSQCPSTIQYHVTDNPPWISQASCVSPVETWGIRSPVDPHHHTMVMKSTCNEAELKFFFNGIRPRHRPHGLLWTYDRRKSGHSPVDKHDLCDIIVTSWLPSWHPSWLPSSGSKVSKSEWAKCAV